jgi:hypothetical protein
MALTERQLAVLSEYHEIIETLLEISESDEFKTAFGDASLGEVIDLYEVSLNEDDSDPILHERYQRLKARLETDDHRQMIDKLRGASLFDDINTEA